MIFATIFLSYLAKQSLHKQGRLAQCYKMVVQVSLRQIIYVNLFSFYILVV